ncbi:sigma-70 family RNA polymerase sigma factor [Gelidibacter salicanalis]|uniref:Sigma-70 family RNA polymerase sigma factor n=1 Tax=Gelidibacter salicanalis TaxID=291193 RepID=A0A934KI46_9FLAO|nr:sigma-70 family RNA polymerase sigma factor [Gelidibacter salicanalis]MBJ7879397.1 sigma-70 family RNA polymerase sigma factor [Gelidibacter salicanalis]
MKTKAVWNLYSEDIKHFILGKVKDDVATDDLLQETFLKVHVKLDTLHDETKLKPWVFAIARHTVMDYFRNHQSISSQAEDHIPADNAPAEHTKEDCLRGIIKSLPKKYRNPLILADIQGLKQAQISERLKLPLPTVKSQIQRGRKLISQGFVECCDFKINNDGYLVGELKEREECKVCH